MNTIIVFTKADDTTRNYLKNYFSGEQITDEDFTYLSVCYANQVSPAIIFIKDNDLDSFEYALRDYLSKLRKANNYFIYYHKSADEYDKHKKLIKEIFPNCFEYRKADVPVGDEGDHHNRDGFHYLHVLNASYSFNDNNEQDFFCHLKNLTNQI
ncbi:hypothetical protein [Mucilaginibacter sp. UYCu711]|uniref:hypothetical protein n=1 Tax=Mucilaginibacter sp. UYCu711 TaxID=3156339 RepID=UPI003D21C304